MTLDATASRTSTIAGATFDLLGWPPGDVGLAQRAGVLPAEPFVDARLVEEVAAEQGQRDLPLGHLLEANAARFRRVRWQRLPPSKGLHDAPAASFGALWRVGLVGELVEHADTRGGEGGADSRKGGLG